MQHKQYKQYDISYTDFNDSLKILFNLDKANDKHHWSLDNFVGNHHIKVASYKTQIVGFIVWNDFGTIEILRLLVDKKFRNQGIAYKLIKAITTKSTILEVRSSNIIAISLYKKLGFKQIAERKNYYKNGQDALIMQLIKNI